MSGLMASTPAPCTQPLTGCAFAESRPMRFVLHPNDFERSEEQSNCTNATDRKRTAESKSNAQAVQIDAACLQAPTGARLHVLVRGANGVDAQLRREGFRQTLALR